MVHFLLIAICFVFSSYTLVPHAAVQKAPEVSFFAGRVSKFHYHSNAKVASGIDLTLSAQVSGLCGYVFCRLFIRCYGNKRAIILSFHATTNPRVCITTHRSMYKLLKKLSTPKSCYSPSQMWNTV